jgi:hypothetical protein
MQNVGRVGGAARHPVDLPEGYHETTRGAELSDVRSRAVEGCAPGRRAVGLRQVDGMPRSTRVVTKPWSGVQLTCN